MNGFLDGGLVQPFDKSPEGIPSLIFLSRLDQLQEFPGQGLEFRLDLEIPEVPLLDRKSVV